MTRVTIATIAALAMLGAGAVQAENLPTLEQYSKTHPAAHQGGPHTWFNVNFLKGKCELSAASPEQTYNTLFTFGHMMGIEVEPISPDNVTKDDEGIIHVEIIATRNGKDIEMDFFTAMAACDQFVTDNGIKPTQADTDDIN